MELSSYGIFLKTSSYHREYLYDAYADRDNIPLALNK